MCYWLKSVLAVLLLATSLLPRNVAAQNTSVTPSAAPEYPDSEAGLKLLLENSFAAVAANDESKMSLYFSGLEIPDHAAWFAKTFGPVEGARLAAKYSEMLPEETKQIKKMFDQALKGQRTIVSVRAIHRPEEIQGLWRAVMLAMVQPATLYSAGSRNPNQKEDYVLGDFVYVNGGFRFVDTRVWQALSTAPPPRIRMGGTVTAASLINKVSPVYPEEARLARLQGTVLLHTIIGKDGAVKQVTVLTGDPALAKAAVEAVQQWRYRPTQLNGNPVEVDTTVSVDFRLRN